MSVKSAFLVAVLVFFSGAGWKESVVEEILRKKAFFGARELCKQLVILYHSDKRVVKPSSYYRCFSYAGEKGGRAEW